MKKIVIIILILGVALAGALYLHHKGYDRKIARKISHLLYRRNKPVKKSNDEYASIFNDKNAIQLRAAKKLGLKQPLKNRSEAEDVKSSLAQINSNDHYKIDKLTHSIPYLTNGAAELLEMIGKNFQDSLKSKGLNPNRIIVTSVLRTQEDITRLKKSGNVNASSNSAHCYATTFDITYARFDKVKMKNLRLYESVDLGTLKMVLGEVLRDLRKQKKCYVKYEMRQKCFHITTRI